MKRRIVQPRNPLLALAFLFPDIFDDVQHALKKYMPYLTVPCLGDVFLDRALRLTLYAIIATDDPDWDIAAEEYGPVKTYVSFRENPIQLCISGKEKRAEEIRRTGNYFAVDHLVKKYAESRLPRKMLGVKKHNSR